MRKLSAIIYSVSAYAASVADQVWHTYRDPNYWNSSEMGFTWSIIVGALFAVLYAVMIYAYGAGSRAIRKDTKILAAYGWSAICGVPFWFIILPLHAFLRDRLGLPDGLWWVESVLLIGISFEAIRLLDGRAKKTPNSERSASPEREAGRRLNKPVE